MFIQWKRDLKELGEAAVDCVVGVAALHRAVHQTHQGPGKEIIVDMIQSKLYETHSTIDRSIDLDQGSKSNF